MINSERERYVLAGDCRYSRYYSTRGEVLGDALKNIMRGRGSLKMRSSMLILLVNEIVLYWLACAVL